MSYAGKVRIDGTDSPIASALFGQCTTPGGTAAKVVTLADFDELITGVVIPVKFSQANTAENPTMNVNNTGDIAIKADGDSAIGSTPSTSWAANSIVLFVYDGTVWRIANTTKALRAEMLAADTALQNNIDGVSGDLTSNVTRIDTDVADRELKMLRFTNKSATFTSGNGITNFPYRAEVTCSGVTSSMVAYVCFSGNNAGSGNYAPYCQTGSGKVYLYAAVSGTITVPSIICWRA